MKTIKIPSRYIYLTNGCCESTGHWKPAVFRRHNVLFQAAESPDGNGPYPLTKREEAYIRESDYLALGGCANFAYTYYAAGVKFFGPEIYFMCCPADRTPTVKERRAALTLAEAALPRFQQAAESWGGAASLTLDDECGDRHIIRCFCPMDQVLAKATPEAWLKYWKLLFRAQPVPVA